MAIAKTTIAFTAAETEFLRQLDLPLSQQQKKEAGIIEGNEISGSAGVFRAIAAAAKKERHSGPFMDGRGAKVDEGRRILESITAKASKASESLAVEQAELKKQNSVYSKLAREIRKGA